MNLFKLICITNYFTKCFQPFISKYWTKRLFFWEGLFRSTFFILIWGILYLFIVTSSIYFDNEKDWNCTFISLILYCQNKKIIEKNDRGAKISMSRNLLHVKKHILCYARTFLFFMHQGASTVPVAVHSSFLVDQSYFNWEL